MKQIKYNNHDLNQFLSYQNSDVTLSLYPHILVYSLNFRISSYRIATFCDIYIILLRS